MRRPLLAVRIGQDKAVLWEDDALVAVVGLGARYFGRLVAAGFRIQTSLLRVSEEARERAIINLFKAYERYYELAPKALASWALTLPYLGIEVSFEGGRLSIRRAHEPLSPPPLVKPFITSTMISIERTSQLKRFLSGGVKEVVRTFGYLPSWLRIASQVSELPLFDAPHLAVSLLNAANDIALVKHAVELVEEEDLGRVVRVGDKWLWRRRGVEVPLAAAPTDVLNLFPIAAWTTLGPPSLLVVESPFAGLSTSASKLAMIAHEIEHAQGGFPFVAVAPAIEELSALYDFGMDARVIVVEDGIAEARLSELGPDDFKKVLLVGST
jgi:hypothetical protein